MRWRQAHTTTFGVLEFCPDWTAKFGKCSRDVRKTICFNFGFKLLQDANFTVKISNTPGISFHSSTSLEITTFVVQITCFLKYPMAYSSA